MGQYLFISKEAGFNLYHLFLPTPPPTPTHNSSLSFFFSFMLLILSSSMLLLSSKPPTCRSPPHCNWEGNGSLDYGLDKCSSIKIPVSILVTCSQCPGNVATRTKCSFPLASLMTCEICSAKCLKGM